MKSLSFVALALTTATLAAASARGATIGQFDIDYYDRHTQTSATGEVSNPVPVGGLAAVFALPIYQRPGYFLAAEGGPNRFTDGSITVPTSTLATDSFNQVFTGGTRGYIQFSPNRLATEGAFPLGNYTFNVLNPTTSATDSATVNIIQRLWSHIPTFTNFSALFSHDPTKPFTVDLAQNVTLFHDSYQYTQLDVIDNTTGVTTVFGGQYAVAGDPFGNAQSYSFTLPANLIARGDSVTFYAVRGSGQGFDPQNAGGDFAYYNYATTNAVTGTFAAVPEPGALALGFAGVGLVGVARMRRR